MIPSDDNDLLDPFEPDPRMAGQRQPDRLSGLTVGLVGLLAAVAVAGVTLFALGGEDETTEPTDDPAAVADSADDLASSTGDGAGAGTGNGDGNEADPPSETETESESQRQTDPAGPTADGSATTTNTPTTAATGSNGSTTTTGARGATTTSSIAGSSDTVEADETTGDPTGGDPTADPTGGDPNAGGTPGPPPTPSTTPAPTTGTCQIPAGGFDGRAGAIDLGIDGACGALSATVQAVNPRDDLADTDWGRDIRVCQRHPAAGEVEIGIRTGSETIDLTEGWSRSAAEAAADPVRSITIEFSDQATPETGPRPVVLCRTDDAELSIVHRPAT